MGNVTAWEFDIAGRTAAETDPRGKVTSYAYNLVDNLTRKTDRLNRDIQYTCVGSG